MPLHVVKMLTTLYYSYDTVLASFPGSTSQLFFARAKKSWKVEPGNEANTVLEPQYLHFAVVAQFIYHYAESLQSCPISSYTKIHIIVQVIQQ